MQGHTSTVRCLKVVQGRPIAVSGSRDSTLRVWDINQGTLIHLLQGHMHSVRGLELFGNLAASGSYDCTARVRSLSSSKAKRKLTRPSYGTSIPVNAFLSTEDISIPYTRSPSMVRRLRLDRLMPPLASGALKRGTFVDS